MISAFFIIPFLLTTIFFAYKAYIFSIIILSLEEEIESSLDILNDRYESMSKILEKEVFFDSVEVRQVIEDIRLSHNAILIIANKLTKNFTENNETQEENNKSIEKKD